MRDTMMPVEARLNRVEGLVRALLSRPAGTGTITFNLEAYDGSDLSGNDGETNRVVTLSGTPTTIIHIIVNNAILHQDVDYSWFGGNTITLTNATNNDQFVEVLYV